MQVSEQDGSQDGWQDDRQDGQQESRQASRRALLAIVAGETMKSASISGLADSPET